MDALLLIIVPFAGYLVAYRLYGKFLAERIFKLRADAPVPSKELEDGVDYVPTRKGIIFGHHYTSIAGTGPIVGPAIGIIWGWVPALVWVFVGSIAMGAVHDLGSLVVSLRNEGKSLSEAAARYVNRRVRTLFFLIVFFELWIVIAIFALVIAVLFNKYAQAVFPVWMEVPIAVALGWAIYKRKVNVAVATLLAVAAMYVTVVAGHFLPISMPEKVLGVLPSTGAWAVILLAYAFVASTLSVKTLLQPRDYINAWQLFLAMGLLLVGAVASGLLGELHLVAPAYNPAPSGAPSLWPFLFVTIACGAISGFHSIVASGTSPKQISNERDALFVGYGSMLMEGALAVLVICAVAGGIGMGYRVEEKRANEVLGPLVTSERLVLPPAGEDGKVLLRGEQAWRVHYASWSDAKGLAPKVEAVVQGSANMIGTLGVPVWLGVVIMGVFIASFAGTTLDTATRLQRYVVGELATDWKIPLLPNRYAATAVAVVTAGALAFITGASGTGAMKLWPMFGAVNQLLAALALLVVTLYLRRRGGLKFLVTALPCLFMLVLTVWAMIVNEGSFLAMGAPDRAARVQRGFLIGFNSAVLLLAAWMTVESVVAFFRGRPAGENG